MLLYRKPNNLESIIQIVFYIYVITIYIFSFKETLNIISNGIFVIFAMLSFLNILKKKSIILNSHYLLILSFTLYSYMSSIWAINSHTSLVKSTTLFSVFLLSFTVFNTFYKTNGAQIILNSLMIAGLIMSIYTVLYYGPSNFFLSLLNGVRLGTEINQANILGLYASSTLIICFYNAMLKNKKYMYIIMPLPFLVTLSSGSRTALATSILGIILLILLKNGTKKMVKGLVAVLTVSIVIYYILQLPLFDSTTQRMEKLFNIFSDQGQVDSSAQMRILMIKYGFEQFNENPIFGYGADNARYLIENILWNTYLHNNFIEMLVDFGLVGFILYYLIYLILFLKVIPLLKYKNPEIITITVLLVIYLLSDFGSVSYYRKITYLIISTGFIAVNYFKNQELEQHKEQT